jgi:hypothetical protein
MEAISNRRFKMSLWAVAALAFAFVILQLFRPTLTNPQVNADLQAPADVKEILKTSCYNCHSNETKLSWFDQPVPAYWLVARDVNAGRAHLNFSEIGKLPAAQQSGILFGSVSQIEVGAMPLPQYVKLRPEAAVTPEQLAILKTYLVSRVPERIATPDEIKAADDQYETWIHAGAAKPSFAPTANGIEFMPGYKDWKAISSTERFDNYTLRQVLGNDVAIKAIADKTINPWPDGTAFAKVAWLEQADGNGSITPGKFFQVEFMIRDSKKYASTLGWGFARWRGTELKPYGKDASFTSECVGCHAPLTGTNYVFTTPIQVQQ